MNDPLARTLDFNWDALNLGVHDLSQLDAQFSEEETFQAIKQIPQDKASGPDGFTGLFFHKC